MYLGEITRHILVALIDAAPKPLLFGGNTSTVLNKHYGLDTSVMSDIERAWEGNDNTEIGGDCPVSTFATFATETLPLSVKAKLERVRVVVIRQLAFKDAEVSLRDAVVCGQ